MRLHYVHQILQPVDPTLTQNGDPPCFLLLRLFWRPQPLLMFDQETCFCSQDPLATAQENNDKATNVKN